MSRRAAGAAGLGLLVLVLTGCGQQCNAAGGPGMEPAALIVPAAPAPRPPAPPAPRPPAPRPAAPAPRQQTAPGPVIIHHSTDSSPFLWAWLFSQSDHDGGQACRQ